MSQPPNEYPEFVRDLGWLFAAIGWAIVFASIYWEKAVGTLFWGVLP
jgi:hypothetical protein